MGCRNKMMQLVVSGYSYKEVPATCGQTSIYGTELLCNECIKKFQKQYPQGWKETPGDICKHGTYVGNAGGPDYMCHKCEMGD